MLPGGRALKARLEAEAEVEVEAEVDSEAEAEAASLPGTPSPAEATPPPGQAESPIRGSIPDAAANANWRLTHAAGVPNSTRARRQLSGGDAGHAAGRAPQHERLRGGAAASATASTSGPSSTGSSHGKHRRSLRRLRSLSQTQGAVTGSLPCSWGEP